MTHSLRFMLLTGVFALQSLLTLAQQSIHINNENALYQEGIELFQKEKYAAAQKRFADYLETRTDLYGEITISARFYHGICALYLTHKDAEYLLETFARMHPDSPLVLQAYFELAAYNYKKRSYKKALEWFDRLDPEDLPEAKRIEFRYKRGHCRFLQDDIPNARQDFIAVKDVESEFKKPATYYFSHISYTEGNYEVALKGFKSLESDPDFRSVVPYYVAQILYLQKKYDEVLAYGPPLIEQGKNVNRLPEIARLTGDAYFRRSDYENALKYFLIYQKETPKNELLRSDHFQTGYCYYQKKDYLNALGSFNQATGEDDELSQNAVYHMADCYLKLDQKTYARNAFKEASDMSHNMEIKEDALFNYAKLAYELSYNPFHEAITAFENYLEAYPNSKRKEEAYEFLLDVYIKSRNYEAALKSLDKMTIKDARTKEAYQIVSFNRAVELFQAGNYEQAWFYFDKVHTYPINATIDAEAVFWKAEIAFKRDFFDQSATLYNQFLGKAGAFNTPFYDDANYGAGYALFKNEQYAAAITAFRKYADGFKGQDKKKLSDTYLRLGDSYYVTKDYSKAIEYYDKAIATKQPGSDYATFQKGICYGLMNNFSAQTDVLEKFITSDPTSRYVVDAKFQLARTYLQTNQNGLARSRYEDIVKNHSTSAYVKGSLLDLCLVHKKLGNKQLAVQTFEQLRAKFPNDKVLKDALSIVKDILIEEKGIDYVNQLSKENPVLDITKQDLDAEVFALASSYYFAQDCNKAVPALEEYLLKFKPAIYEIEANFYLAECHFKANDKNRALEHYNKVINASTSDFTQASLLAAATINFNNGNFSAALSNYQKLEQVAVSKNNQLEAEIGQMRCNYKLGNFSAVESYAERVLGNASTPDAIREEALMLRGMVRFDQNNWDAAYNDFKEVAKKVNARGAEAKYHMCLVAYKKQAYKAAEQEIFELIQKFSAYDEWKYKGFLLLADAYIGLKDYFQARTTLQAILTNVQELWVRTEAEKKLAIVDQLEKGQTPGGGSNAPEINLNQN
jgi:tetratricopeptide (TPR) repeat protein